MQVSICFQVPLESVSGYNFCSLSERDIHGADPSRGHGICSLHDASISPENQLDDLLDDHKNRLNSLIKRMSFVGKEGLQRMSATRERGMYCSKVVANP